MTDASKEYRTSSNAAGPPRKIFPEKSIEVGDDEITKRERAMGLDINEKTGRAYKSQGDFHNLGLQAGGHFRDGNALPAAFTCAACSTVVVGKDWRAIYDNCSAVTCGSLRFDVEFHICRECTLKVLNLFPNIKGIMAAMHGGDLKRG
jgi:hypothetical protein